MNDIAGMLQRLEDKGRIRAVMNNPRLMFSIQGRQYVGATLLPPSPRRKNTYREYGVKFKSIVANSGTRYSPVTKRQAGRAGSVLVELGEHDAGAELVGEDLEALRIALNNGELAGAPSAESILAQFLVLNVVQPMVDIAEKETMEALTDAIVYRRGDGYSQNVLQPNPVGHRLTVADPMSDPDANPLIALEAQLNFMKDKGYPISRIIVSNAWLQKFRRHPLVIREMLGAARGAVADTLFPGAIQLDTINGWLSATGYQTTIEVYDLTYNTLFGPKRFLRANATLMISTNPVSQETIEALTGTSVLPAPTSLGYYGIGIAENQSEPGRVAFPEYFGRDKPARIEAKGWGTGGPVILTPEAVACLNWDITTAQPV